MRPRLTTSLPFSEFRLLPEAYLMRVVDDKGRILCGVKRHYVMQRYAKPALERRRIRAAQRDVEPLVTVNAGPNPTAPSLRRTRIDPLRGVVLSGMTTVMLCGVQADD